MFGLLNTYLSTWWLQLPLIPIYWFCCCLIFCFVGMDGRRFCSIVCIHVVCVDYCVCNDVRVLLSLLIISLRLVAFLIGLVHVCVWGGGAVKPVLSGHSNIDKTKISMANWSLTKVESIAECSPWSILRYF